MSTFKTFFMGLPIAERDEFARRCATSAKHLTNIAYGYRPCGEGLCIAIERESAGAVRCEDLRPDVDWAYLRATDCPECPVKEAA